MSAGRLVEQRGLDLGIELDRLELERGRSLNPSESDSKITQKIKEAGNLMDIQLLDHLIISDKEYYSFADNGLL